MIVTGAAGFIGSALALKLLERGDDIVGIDNLNEYYDVNLKLARLGRLTDFQNFKFIKLDIADKVAVLQAFAEQQCSKVMHLAAQAGVRYSITNPDAYINSNIVGFMNILEASRLYAVEHLAYASTSSIYGANTRMPFSIHDNVDHPVSLYAASKKANELMAHTYSHLYQLPTTGLRFFTVYGPWGRPDMSPFTFTRNIIEDKPIDVFNYVLNKLEFDFGVLHFAAIGQKVGITIEIGVYLLTHNTQGLVGPSASFAFGIVETSKIPLKFGTAEFVGFVFQEGISLTFIGIVTPPFAVEQWHVSNHFVGSIERQFLIDRPFFV